MEKGLIILLGAGLVVVTARRRRARNIERYLKIQNEAYWFNKLRTDLKG
jgi:hypothetical protein